MPRPAKEKRRVYARVPVPIERKKKERDFPPVVPPTMQSSDWRQDVGDETMDLRSRIYPSLVADERKRTSTRSGRKKRVPIPDSDSSASDFEPAPPRKRRKPAVRRRKGGCGCCCFSTKWLFARNGCLARNLGYALTGGLIFLLLLTLVTRDV